LQTKFGDSRFSRSGDMIASIKIDKKLSCRRGTARRPVLVSSCYVSDGMGVRKVSVRKGDLQSHLRALAMVPFDRPHTMS